MQYTVNRNGTSVNVSIAGRLTFADAPHFPKFLQESMSGAKECRVDLTSLDFIDSTGMSLFIHVYDQARAGEVKVTLTGTKGTVHEVLQRAGFEDLFPFE
jgi:anti-anti-sigma factor